MNKRYTIQRSLVSEMVKYMQNHVTADEVYDEIVKKHPNVSRATVYRNLKNLSDSGEIRKVEIPSAADRYDRILHDHYHAKCTKCGNIYDVDMNYIPDLEKKINDTHGFKFTGHDVIFKCICPKCIGN